MTIEQLAQKLAQFKSTHDNPVAMEECLSFCIDFLKKFPVIVKRYECNGLKSIVIKTQDTDNLDVLFLGHIDTVPGHDRLFEGTMEEGKLYGRGTLDMKAFVATSLFVLKELLEEGYYGSVGVAVVTDEELGGINGARYLAEDIGYKAKVVLNPDDGEDIRTIIERTKHILQIRFKAKGEEAHAARPWNGSNAIESLMDVYKKLKDTNHFTFSEPKDLWVNTMNLGVLSGGTAANEVPGEAEMKIDFRLTDTLSREALCTLLKKLCSPDVSFEVVLEGYPNVLDLDSPVVQTYAQCVQDVTGMSARFIQTGGGTDGRFFAAKGMPVIVHQGTGAYCQSDREHVEVKSLRQLVDIQKKFIKQQFLAKSG